MTCVCACVGCGRAALVDARRSQKPNTPAAQGMSDLELERRQAGWWRRRARARRAQRLTPRASRPAEGAALARHQRLCLAGALGGAPSAQGSHRRASAAIVLGKCAGRLAREWRHGGGGVGRRRTRAQAARRRRSCKRKLSATPTRRARRRAASALSSLPTTRTRCRRCDASTTTSVRQTAGDARHTRFDPLMVSRARAQICFRRTRCVRWSSLRWRTRACCTSAPCARRLCAGAAGAPRLA